MAGEIALSAATIAPRDGAVALARVWHAATAVIGVFGLVLGAVLAATDDGSNGVLNGLVFFLSFFTILSNIVVAATETSLAVDPARDSAVFRWFRITGLVMITITGIVYAIVLAPLSNPQGPDVITNLIYHQLIPVAAVVGWLVFGPRPRFTWDLVPKLLVIPLIWLTYTLVHGAFTTNPPVWDAEEDLGPRNWYPYPFLDVADLGYAAVLTNIAVIAVAGMAFGLIFVALDKALSRISR